MIWTSKIDVILQSSWRVSFVTLLRDLSGQGLELKKGSIVEGMKGFHRKKKPLSSTATKF